MEMSHLPRRLEIGKAHSIYIAYHSCTMNLDLSLQSSCLPADEFAAVRERWPMFCCLRSAGYLTMCGLKSRINLLSVRHCMRSFSAPSNECISFYFFNI